MKANMKFRMPLYDKDGKFKEWFYWGFLNEFDGEFKTPLSNYREVEQYQFTSKLDKNNREIYEGDVLEYLESEAPDYREEWDYEKQGHVPQRAIMRFDETYFGYRLNVQSRFKITLEMVKVIGNIFENPELVNNEK